LVIDALDECDEQDAETILSLFAQEVPQIPRLRVFITTRPEPHIRGHFQQHRDHEQLHLHDIDGSIVQADIRLYLEFRLAKEQVRKALRLSSTTWQPTKEQMDMLVGMSGNVFIIAATAASFILERKQANPARQLSILLDGISVTDFSGSKHATGIDAMYMGIIRAAQPNPAGN
jgi:hypothetical protein